MFKRTAVYVRGKTRTRKVKSAFGAFLSIVIATVLVQLLAVTPAQAAGSTDCPGGTYSGKGATNCSNLRNKNLNNQRAFPSLLYRGDSREPNEIFRTGLFARGTNNNLVSHIQGDKTNNSNYISTSGTLSLSETFARSQGMRNLDSAIKTPGCSSGKMAVWGIIPFLGSYMLKDCAYDVVHAYSYVYLIDPKMAKNAVYVPDQIRGNKALYNQYHSQDEWAFVRKIPREAITGVRMYKMSVKVDRAGRMMLQTLTFKYDKFWVNGYHTTAATTMANYHPYDPVNDPLAQWNYYSDLHTPNILSYDRVCTGLQNCRNNNGGASSSSAPPPPTARVSGPNLSLGVGIGSGLN
ncbi:hypothetical protein OG352_25575 [Streptomyces sp. NBC_01485]|uniref:hypothetical protein n=1 Tax=Streptomyces sp. NBC_01485 TaxID=2903884 RepID=UPI002E3159DE|nr:hypothetical protein [Streptomyces sp. NBC_01485]